MAQEPKTDGTSQAAASPAQQTTADLSPGEAAKLMSITVENMRKNWLQSAVTIASILKNGKNVNRGTFEDLRLARENYEELERARQFLFNMEKVAAQAAEAAQAGGSAKKNGGG